MSADSYQVMLDLHDEWHAKNHDLNQEAWLETARHLDRVIVAGTRMAEFLLAVSRNADAETCDRIGSLMNAWHHAVRTN